MLQMLQMLLEHGNRHDLTSDAEVSTAGCVLVSPEATAESIDRGVYMHLNKYTNPLAQHIRARLNGEGAPEQVSAYRNAMLVVCGDNTFDRPAVNQRDLPTRNAMHVGQAANFDTVTTADFDTTSTMHYLISNDAYHGNLLLMPAENQHVQQATAHVLLPAALDARGNRVETAGDINDLRSKLDNMVVTNPTTNARLGDATMQSLHESTNKEGRQATTKVVGRLMGRRQTNGTEFQQTFDNTLNANLSDRTALRRLNKVMLPALKALSEDRAFVEIRMTSKQDARQIAVRDLIAELRDPVRAGALMGAEFGRTRSQIPKATQALHDLVNMGPGPERQQAAADYMRGEYSDRTYILG